MKQEDKELLLRYLCMALPYKVKVCLYERETCVLLGIDGYDVYLDVDSDPFRIESIKPYLRPMSSMTEEEAKEISILYGIKDILSTKITDKYIEVVVDDNFSSTEKRTIWYNEIVSSIEILDWLNVHHFDYLNLIEKGLAIEITEK